MSRVFTQYLIDRILKQHGIYQNCFHFSDIPRLKVNRVMRGTQVTFFVDVVPLVKRNTTFL